MNWKMIVVKLDDNMLSLSSVYAIVTARMSSMLLRYCVNPMDTFCCLHHEVILLDMSGLIGSLIILKDESPSFFHGAGGRAKITKLANFASSYLITNLIQNGNG